MDRIEDFVKNKIAYNLTTSPILHAVKNVWLENEKFEDEHKNGEILKVRSQKIFFKQI